MSGAAEARNGVAALALSLYERLRDAAGAYGRAYSSLAKSDDLTDTLRHSVNLLVAAEALGSEADNAALALRTKLAETMAETGATTVRSQRHSAHVSTKPDRVHVFNLEEIPDELMMRPPPRPDLSRIREIIRNGKPVPGVAMVGNGEPILRIVPNKRDVA